MGKEKVLLIIMDGWGIAENPLVSAIDAAQTPFYERAKATWAHAKLQASGNAVGLPEGQMGNSEVGHMNIGAGRVVYQDLVRLTKAIETGDFSQNPEWRKMLAYCLDEGHPLHLMGLLSDGGVHSHIKHLKGILSLLAQEGRVPEVFIHCFMDGRDTDPHSGLGYVQDLEAHCAKLGMGKIASLIGRYYAMDRNQKWGRVRKAYDLLIYGRGVAFNSAEAAVRHAYASDVTDEFMEPAVITDPAGTPLCTLNEGDAVLFFNFRTDRGRQLSTVLTQCDMREYNMHARNLYFATMTRYDEGYHDVHVLYGKEDISEGLGETLSKLGKTQIRIAETEKYPHVTFFFNGGHEEPWEGAEHILCESPNVRTYDLQPEMSAEEVRDQIIPRLQAKNGPDFVCLNFANPDMVGHTGVWEAAIKACETVDACTQAVAEAALAAGYRVLITADHGNVDKMINEDGSPHTAHTTALVPLILALPEGDAFSAAKLADGRLGDIAPTILQLMDLPKPEVMTGQSLLRS